MLTVCCIQFLLGGQPPGGTAFWGEQPTSKEELQMRTHKTARSGTAVLLSVACLLGLGILAVPASPLLAVQQADPPPDAVPAEIPTAID